MAEIEVATFEQIATLLSQLSNNYSNIAVNYYDMFYNPVPQDVKVQLYDKEGVLHDYLVPNRAKDFRYVLNGEGSPEGFISASKGSTYQDIRNGKFYIKQLGEGNKGWVELAPNEDFVTGEGSPEGVVTKPKGALYVDTVEGVLYIKSTSAGNTGWVRISFDEGYVANTDLDNLTSKGEAKFANPSLSNLNSLGEAKFANSSLSNLNDFGQGIIDSKEDVVNKVTYLGASSTDTQYPSAKATYDTITEAVQVASAGLANTRLSNLEEEGEDKLNTSKGYTTGNVSYDKKMYQQLLQRKRSTFDINKFGLFGDVVVTEEGTAKDFDSFSFVTSGAYKFFPQENAWKIQLSFKTPETFNLANECILSWMENAIVLEIKNDGTLRFSINNESGSILEHLTTSLETEKEYFAVMEYDGNEEYKVSWAKDGEPFKEYKTSSVSKIANGNLPFTLGKHYSDPSSTFGGSINLKQFAVFINKKEVFNGNKTGIEAIKRDSFDIIGDLKITEDGVASSFSASKYLTKAIKLDLVKGFKIEGSFKTDSFNGNKQTIFSTQSNGAEFALGISTDNKIALYHPEDTEGLTEHTGITLSPNKEYFYKVEFSSDKLMCFFGDSRENMVNFLPVDMMTSFGTATVLNIGINVTLGNNFLGEIDLNDFKVYINEDLVYQPCLKIPYNLSKTGSKVVNYEYRPRVISNYEEEGKALFYTIDEFSHNYTLPMGELYGMLGEGGVGNPDNVTIKVNLDKQLQAVGTLEKNKGTPIYDWVGTLGEYQAQKIATEHPTWVCYITDDVSGGDSVYTKAEIDEMISGSSGHYLGEWIMATTAESVTPEGCIKPDGFEQAQADQSMFADLWNNALSPTADWMKQLRFPIFNSNNQDNYVISDSRNNQDIYKVFNGVKTYDIKGAWKDYRIQVQLPVAGALGSYSVKSSTTNPVEYPSSWKVQGSNNGTLWEDIDIVTSQAFRAGEEKAYLVSGQEEYLYYSILFVDGTISGGTGLLGKVQFNVNKQSTYLDTCTYEEYENSMNSFGACTKWAVDYIEKKFKVPFIPDGYSFKKGEGLIENKKVSVPVVDESVIKGEPEITNFNEVTSRWFIYVANGKIGSFTVNWDKMQGSLISKANVDLDNLSKVGMSKLGGVNKDLSNLSEEGEKHFLGDRNITNCITEIPQDIKLELRDGTLTLKAGSKVYIPNGTNIYEIVTIAKDYTITVNKNSEYFLFLVVKPQDLSILGIGERLISEATSGSEAPTTGTFYNTSSNKINQYKNNVIDGTYQYSFPIAAFSVAGNKITSINNVFNGFGYIGSTAFALPNVKYLIPNGRNKDGSFKNIEKTIDKIKIFTRTWDATYSQFSFIKESGVLWCYNHYYEQDTSPTLVDYSVWYDTANNYIYKHEKTDGWVKQSDGIFLGWYGFDGTSKINGWETKQPFHALDYNDFQSTPHITESYVNGASGYRLYSDGYCEQWGRSMVPIKTDQSQTIHLLKPYKDTNYTIINVNISSGTGTGNDASCNAVKLSGINASSFILQQDQSMGGGIKGFIWRTTGYINL